MTKPCILLLLVTSYLPAFAGDADVLDVEVSCRSDSICRFDLAVRHDDEGWNHYANRWEVLYPDGKVLAARVLAHDLVHKYGGKELVVELPN